MGDIGEPYFYSRLRRYTRCELSDLSITYIYLSKPNPNMHLADLGKSVKKHPEIAQGEEVESFPLLGSTQGYSSADAGSFGMVSIKKGLRFSRPLLGPARLSAARSAWGVTM